jgi:hypothetical protein
MFFIKNFLYFNFRLLPHQTRFSNNRHGYVGKQTADELSCSFEAVMHIPGRRLAPV